MESNPRTFFKVVRVEKPSWRWGHWFIRYMSATVLGKQTRYRSKRWTSHPLNCGPLCVFDSYAHLREFFVDMKGKAVFVCEIEPSAEHGVWDDIGRIGGCMPLSILPVGTILAEKVKLLFEVESA
jgi:hypothetical protein